MEKYKASRQVEREISAETDAVVTTLKSKTNTWNKNCNQSVKRESELYKMVEAAAIDERQETKERIVVKDLLEQLQKRREEEDEATGLMEEMQRNLDEAQRRSHEVERKLDRVLGEYIEAFEKEMRRPQLVMNKMWQRMQSRDTKNLNLDKDFEEIMSKVKQVGWNESTRTKRILQTERRCRSVVSGAVRSSCKMEGIMSLLTEWFSSEEMRAPQGVCVLTSVWAREWLPDRSGRPGVERSIG